MSTAELWAAAIVVAILAVALLVRSGRPSQRDARSALSGSPPADLRHVLARHPDPGSSAARPLSGSRSGAGDDVPTDRRRELRWGRLRVGARARAPTSDEVAASMVLLAVALQSGCGVVEAIEEGAEVAPPLPAAELHVVAAALRWGVPEDRAWAEVSPRWSRTAMALRLAREAGVPPSSLLLSGAGDLREARLAAVDVAAARLGVRLVVPLGVAFLPAFVLTTIVPVVLALARQVLAS